MRRDHRKRRTGCKQCRKRRVKCDEAKPTCINCVRNRLQCSLEFLTPSLPKPDSKKPRDPATSSRSTPLQIPSPIQDVILQPTSLDIHSLELLHHYTSTTCFTFGDEKRTFLWQKEIPQMAISHEFLMHGLLAISALHLSTLQPHRKVELIQRAAESEQLGLPSFRDFISSDDPQKIHAVTAFAGFVVPYLVVCNSGATSTGRIPSLHDEHPHWFFAFRGLLQMVGRSWMHLRTGPFSPLLVPGHPTVRYAGNPDDAQLAKLQQLFEPSNYSFGKGREDLAACKAALEELRRLCACLHKSVTVVRTQVMIAIHVWPGTVSQRFVELMDERRPEALVLLAHYCVLLKKVNSCWWLQGVGEKLLMAIDRSLGSEWRPWIEWALKHPMY